MKRHVSAYSEAIIRFKKFYETKYRVAQKNVYTLYSSISLE